MIEVKEDYSLKPYNTFAIDVKCRYFVESDEEEALRAFVADYEWQPSEVLILGGGSNFLFTEDFTGTVFYPAMQGKEVIKEDEEEVWVRIGAGVEWDDFVAWTVEQGWGGVENLSFIPGHVGAAPVQNVGAYGMEAGERIMLDVEGTQYDALIKDVAYNPVAGRIDEIDFQALVSTEKVHSVVEVVLENHDKIAEGVLQESLEEIAYKALPADLVDEVRVDVGDMKIGDVIRVKDLPIYADKKITIMTDPDAVVVALNAAHNAAVPEPETAETEEEPKKDE